MKNLIFPILAIFSITLLSASCKKHVVQPQTELSKLPPATQTGANTFGCLVNGKAFTSQNRNVFEGPVLQCNYIYTGGGYYFTLHVANKNADNSVTVVNVGTDSLAIASGETLMLGVSSSGNATAGYILIFNPGENAYGTNNTAKGELKIDKLDTINQIVSGTFHFNAVNSKGDTAKITDGRFDMHYTQ